MNRWEWYTRRIRRFGDKITPAVENLTLDSLKHFKQEPALWIGAIGVAVTAVNGARTAGADGWTVAAAVVIAVGGFVARAYVSPKDRGQSIGGLVTNKYVPGLKERAAALDAMTFADGEVKAILDREDGYVSHDELMDRIENVSPANVADPE